MKNIIIIAVIIGAMYIGYKTFFTEPEGSNLLKVQNVSSTQILGTDIIKAINQINSLQLDSSVFSDPVFLSLEDRSQVIAPQPRGKNNPFSILGAGQANNSPQVTQ